MAKRFQIVRTNADTLEQTNAGSEVKTENKAILRRDRMRAMLRSVEPGSSDWFLIFQTR